MIKFRATLDNRNVIGFILEERNLERLREGNLIYIYREEIGLPFDIIIDFSHDLEKTMEDMKKRGLIGEKTVVHDERDRKKS